VCFLLEWKLKAKICLNMFKYVICAAGKSMRGGATPIELE
jgi:hypothetical protein